MATKATDPMPILRALLAGTLGAPEAARAFLALEGPAAHGLVLGGTVFTQEELQTLAPLVAAVRWETAKILAPGRLPDVPYDSPEHRAFMASVPGDESS